MVTCNRAFAKDEDCLHFTFELGARFVTQSCRSSAMVAPLAFAVAFTVIPGRCEASNPE
jgi:hypothetical protein